jgi:hypothetical protein
MLGGVSAKSSGSLGEAFSLDSILVKGILELVVANESLTFKTITALKLLYMNLASLGLILEKSMAVVNLTFNLMVLLVCKV